MGFEDIKIISEEYKNSYSSYEDKYLKIIELKVESYNDVMGSEVRCAKLKLKFKELTNERLQKVVYLHLKWLYNFIEVDFLEPLIESIALKDFCKVRIIATCIRGSFRNKLYQEIILNNLLEVDPPKNIELTMKVPPQQIEYLYSNIEYFNFDTVILMESLPLNILMKKINEITMITNTIINIQINMDFQFILSNINRYHYSNIQHLLQIKRISLNEFQTLMLAKEMM